MKLLKEISFRYLAAALALFLVSLPLLYLGLQKVITETVDEELVHQKVWVIQKLKAVSPEQIQDLNPNIRIEKTSNPGEDRLYNENLYVAVDKEIVPHRILSTSTIVHGTVYLIYIKKSLIETDDVISSITWLLALFLFILLVSLYFVNTAVSKKIWTPFNQTLEALKNFRVDQGEAMQLPAANISEFKDLQYSILKLADTNTQLFKAQKTFTENAAHELQTPIAVILANIDLLLQQPGLNAEQASHIENISLAANKIKRLNKALLLLSKIENNAFITVSDTDLSNLAQEALHSREAIIKNKALTIAFSSRGPFTVNMNKDLGDILMGNLVWNAILHSANKSNIVIESSQENFIISNSDESGALERERIFQRFQKQTANPNSLGLGLEICRQICKVSGLELQYDFANGFHCFKLSKTPGSSFPS